MRPTDRARLTAALREHVARIAADLRARLRQEGPARDRAKQLHSDEQVGEDFDVWTDLLSRRAAVLWVLKSVYVRVLEDRGLLNPGRILDPESQQLFEKLAPNLGDSAFLRWIYRDLATPRGGLPELFAPQPAEIAVPQDKLSRDLIKLWRDEDPDTGARWSFAEERFEGELMGDLYQELDPVVKDRFALCQTPDFVRAFILDRTLTPAIETFGADKVRLLDPACGSGHFLIDGLKRLCAATEAQHPDWNRMKRVRHCLDRVVGIDLNDYACALARTRLVMTAAELAGVTSLAEAAQFHPHVYWADGLEQVEREETKPTLQFDLFEKTEERPRATLTRSDVRAALKKVFKEKFHAVVANPPYITEKDPARKEYHREKKGKTQRYISAYREYSLGSPFTERCFQLAVPDGYVGLITGNNFMKREHGKPLIEKVLANLDLTLVVDTSQAYIPFHGTPTVLIFGRNRARTSEHVRAVMGKRGETGTPEEPARGRVWSSIVDGWNTVGFENEYVSVTDVLRATLSKHPWSLGGGGAAELREQIERTAGRKLSHVCESIGFMAITGADEVFLQPLAVLVRHRVTHTRPMVTGDALRDWTLAPVEQTLWPNDDLGNAQPKAELEDVIRFCWPYRTVLRERRVFSRPIEERGINWWEVREVYRDRFQSRLSIAFAEVATHNHFLLDRGGNIFKQTTPVIKLPVGATEDEHLALLGILNSSTSCFWMKQVFHPKGSATRDTMNPENNRHAFASTGLLSFPVPSGWQSPTAQGFARRIDEKARERQQLSPASLLANSEYHSQSELRAALRQAEAEDARLLRQMIFLQEELDWAVYGLYGLHSGPVVDTELEITTEQRPFAWSSDDGPADLPAALKNVYSQRRKALLDDKNLGLIENAVCKRLWRGSSGEGGRYGESYEDKTRQALFTWLCERVEVTLKDRGRPATLAHIVAAVQDDSRFLAAVGVYQDRQDIDLNGLVTEVLQSESVANHPLHIYTESGLAKRAAWEETWALQRREDAGEKIENIPVPPEYSQGSRGKAMDFLRTEYWKLRGSLDVPKERFIAFTEVPGRDAANTLYGWAGWTPLQRVKALLAMDEELEDAGSSIEDRIGVLDSAWRLLPDVAREDAAVAGRLKAELQALVGLDGPSRQLLEEWRQKFPPPGTRAARATEKTAKRAKKAS